MLRLNTSIPPTSKPNYLGLIGGDAAGFPNGRRVFDDVVTVELRAIAGATYPLVDKSYKPDAAASAITDGLTPADVSSRYLDVFPYLGGPYSGYYTPDATPPTPPAASDRIIAPARHRLDGLAGAHHSAVLQILGAAKFSDGKGAQHDRVSRRSHRTRHRCPGSRR